MPEFCILFYANYTILATQRGAMAKWPPLNTPLISSPPQSFFFIKYRRYGLLLVSFIKPVALQGGNTAFPSPHWSACQNAEQRKYNILTIFCIEIDLKNDFKLVLKHLFTRKS